MEQRTYAAAALDEDARFATLQDDVDDLEWVERRIRWVEDGPRSPFDMTPDKLRQRQAYLQRLYGIRDRLKGEA